MRQFILFSFVILICSTVPATSATLEVCSACQYNSISDALLNAEPNDTVYVHDGTYNEFNLNIFADDITITGQSRDGTIIDADGLGRHFNFTSAGSKTTIQNLTLKNGVGSPGVCSVQGQGGSICARNVALNIDAVTFQNNIGVAAGGAIHLDGDPSIPRSLSIKNSTFSDNHLIEAPSLLLAQGFGGAIACVSCDRLSIDSSIFQKNSSHIELVGPDNAGIGGAIWMAQSAFNPNSIQFTSTNNTFDSNRSLKEGGAIALYAPRSSHNDLSSYTISETAFINNYAGTKGGAIFFGNLSSLGDPALVALNIERSLFHKNRAANGGALASVNMSVLSEDSTFSMNTASITGGAVELYRNNIVESQSHHFANVSFIANRVLDQNGAAVFAFSINPTLYLTSNTLFLGELQLFNSIVHNSNGVECVFSGGQQVIVGEHNFTNDDSCEPSPSANLSVLGSAEPFSLGSVNGIDTRLAANGGPTLTYALLKGSNAINASTNNCPSVIRPSSRKRFDQRGENRSARSPFSLSTLVCDVGAYEYIERSVNVGRNTVTK
ncbi:choice-of-anchor Q domain-containing protein [Arenicella xantha]|uniref:Putative outer membrane repeat protein n=1 Tax=Arenicella xantha TaxID=644221 RepID=A0A395JL00_9GAMM|nr:choice-of-anchor Q domain-containing protein [Arenicella xantha]RBP51105.1 putative outer membrane repeat protein [Arenicella xantha]